MKRLFTLLLCVAVLFLQTGCVYNAATHFNEEEHVGTRLVCREVDLYFDSVEVEETIPPEPGVADAKETTVQYVWHPGELTVNGSTYYVEAIFGYPASFDLSYAEDPSRPNDAYHEEGESVLCGHYEWKDEILTVYLATADAFSSLTGYTGDKLTFVCE